MSILSLIGAGALTNARNAILAGRSLGEVISNLRDRFSSGRGSRSTYEDFRNVVRRAQRQVKAAERLNAGEKPTKSTRLPTLPESPSRPAGQHEYETIVKITPADGGRIERIPVTVISPTAMTPQQIQDMAQTNLQTMLASRETTTMTGFAQIDQTGAPPRVDVIIVSAAVRD